MTNVAEAFVTLRPDTKGFKNDADRQIGAPLKGIATAAAGAFAAIGVAGLFKDAIAEGREAEKVQRQTNAAIASTGGVANVTSGHIGDLANRLSNLSGIDDETIQSSQNLLLTFTNIHNEVGKGKDIFDRASQAILDMSAVQGDLQSNTILVGKALQDPIKGVTALQRVGVKLTDQQKEQIKQMIKVGDTAGAQAVILKELGTEFGGQAAAAADPMQKLGVVFKNLEETLGTALLPALNKVATFLANNLPGALDKAGKAIGPLIEAAKQVFNVLFNGDFTGGPFAEDSKFIDTLFNIRDAFIEDVLPVVQEVVGWLEDHWQVALAAAGGAVLLLISPIAAVVAAVIVAWTQFQTFRDVVSAVVDAVVGFWNRYRDSITEVLKSVGETFSAAFGAIQAVVEKVVAVLTDLWDRFGHTLLDKLRIAFEAIVEILHGALTVMSGVFDLIKAILTGKWGEAWDAIKKILSGVLEELAGMLRLGLDALALVFEAAKAAVSAAWSAIWNGLKTLLSDALSGYVAAVKWEFNTIVDFITSLPGRIASAASGMWDGVKNAFRSAINFIIRGWNALEFKVPGFSVGPVHFGGFTLGLPDIPLLDQGGEVLKTGLAVVHRGERFSGVNNQFPIGDDRPQPIQFILNDKVLFEALGFGNWRQQRRAS